MVIQNSDGQIKLVLDQDGELKDLFAEQIFVAQGRVPNINGLQLEKAESSTWPYGIKPMNICKLQRLISMHVAMSPRQRNLRIWLPFRQISVR